MSAYFHGPIEQRSERLSNASGIGASHGVFEDDGELVAAGSRNRIGAAHTASEEDADMFQQLVADVVSDGVVDQLELIQIDEHECDLGARAPGPDERTVQTVLEEPAIRQAGQFVVQRQVFVFFDLAFQKQEDHAHGDDIFRQVPYLTFEVKVRQDDRERWT